MSRVSEGEKLSSVTVTVNGRTYKMACDEGEERHLLGLAAHVNGHVETIMEEVGQVGDTRLLLMAAITVADELNEAHKRIATLENEVQKVKGARDAATGQYQDAQQAAARALDAAVTRIEDVTRQINGNRR